MAAASPRTWRGAAQRASRSTSLRAQSARFAVTGGTCRAYRRLLNLAPADRLRPAERRSGAGGGLYRRYLGCLSAQSPLDLPSQSHRGALRRGTCRLRRDLRGQYGGLCYLAGHRHRGELCGAALDYFQEGGSQGRRQAGSVLALVRSAEIFLAPAVVELEPFDKAGRVVALDQEEPAKAGKFLRQ